MRVRFDELPRRIRERLVELSKNPKDPCVLVADTGLPGGWFKYVSLVVGLGISAFALHFLLERSADHIAPRHDQEVFAALAGGVFLALVSAASIAFVKLFPPPPYKTGQWALSSYLMRLSRGWVELFPLSELGKPTIVTVLRNGAYSGSRLQLDFGFTFFFSSRSDVDQACGRILAAREAFARAVGAKDAGALAALDPFSECTLSGSWKAPGALEDREGPRSGEVPAVARLVQWLGALGAGAGVAAAAYSIFSSIHTAAR